jgi:predicted TIM-barrel fold metal-dependent hydrolase
MRRSFLALTLLVTSSVLGQSTGTMTFEEYDPKSTLVVPEHPRTKAKYPFIDVHNHQPRDMAPANVQQLVADMDRIGMAVMVNLSGGSGLELQKGLAALRIVQPKRFVAFANVDFSRIDDPRFGEEAAKQLEVDVKQHGAVGLKIFKNLGLTLTDKAGNRASWRPRTSTSTTTASATRSGRCTASACRTRC